jgi:two-component system sensor histidine kinase PilS (NtrC family)
MASLWLIKNNTNEEKSILENEARWILGEWCKAIGYFLAFLFYFVSSLSEKLFIDVGVSQKLFFIAAIATISHIVGIHKKDMGVASRPWLSTTYFIDALLISLLVILFKGESSIILLLISMNVIIAAFVGGMQFSLKVALFSSAILNLSFLLTVPFGPYLVKVILTYNAALIILSLLAGILSEEIKEIALIAEKRAKSIQELQNLNEFVIDAMASGILVVDRMGVIIKANRMAMRLFSDYGIVSRGLQQILPGLWPMIKDRADVQQMDWKYISVQGQAQKLELSISSLNTDRGQVAHTILVRNVTEVRELEQKLRQTEKLAAVGQLAAGIAHEIRNPLASISGSVQLLAVSLKPEAEEDKKLLAIVIKEIDRLNNLISEFMDYVRPDVVADDILNFNEMLNEILDISAHNESLPKGIQIFKDLNRVTVLRGNAAKMRQALLNIIVNAYQAMEKTERKRMDVKLHMDEKVILIEVRDTGVGISEENIHRIFEPFHTTKANGTGLGLAITQKIIESHGGHIEVESQLGVGSLFRIVIPKESH